MDWLAIGLRGGLLSLHLISNALAGGAPLAAALLPGQDHDRQRLAWFGVVGLVLGILSGGLSVCFVLAGGISGYQAAAARVPTGAYLMLATEWSFTAILYAVYLLYWRRLSHRRVLHGLIAVVAATNLLYHFPTLMIVLAQLAGDPAMTDAEVVSRPVLVRLIWTPHTLTQTFHFWGLSTTVTGVAGMLLPSLRKASRLVALFGVVVLILSGSGMLWYGTTARELTSPSTAAGWLMLGGVTCGLLLVTQLASEIAGAQDRPSRNIGLVTAGVLLMTAASLAI